MRILNIVIAKVWGGGEQYVYDTSKALHQQGVEVFVAVDESCIEMAERFSQVARVTIFALHSMAGMGSFFKLRAFIKDNKIDVINCHSGHAMALCILLRLTTSVKLVCFKHNAIMAKKDSYHQWQRKHTDAFVCVSNLVYDLQTKGLTSEEKQKFHLIYNGIDVDKYSKVFNTGRKKDGCYIGYAGRLAKDKGIDVLLKAFKKIVVKYPEIKLLLAGSDEKGYKAILEQRICDFELDNRVVFLGQIQDMPSFYAKLRIFVLPSVVKEAFGLTICEAMYSGVPVITTDSGAQREIISNDEEGCIVPKENVAALAEALDKLLQNDKLACNIGETGRKRVEENFTSQKCALHLKALYEQL